MNARLDTRETIESRSDIEAEHRAAVGKGRSGIVVDNVSDFLTRLWTVNDPIMSVEWWFGAVTKRTKTLGNSGNSGKWIGTDLKRDGNSHPATINRRAFGDNWPGFPLNLDRYGSEFLTGIYRENQNHELEEQKER